MNKLHRDAKLQQKRDKMTKGHIKRHKMTAIRCITAINRLQVNKNRCKATTKTHNDLKEMQSDDKDTLLRDAKWL